MKRLFCEEIDGLWLRLEPRGARCLWTLHDTFGQLPGKALVGHDSRPVFGESRSWGDVGFDPGFAGSGTPGHERECLLEQRTRRLRALQRSAAH